MNIRKEFIKVKCERKDCPRYNDPCCKISSEIDRVTDYNDIDLFFIGMGGGWREEKLHFPFCGKSGSYMRSIIKYLWELGILFNIALSNTIRGHPKDAQGKDRPPTEEEEQHCRRYLVEDIEKIKPRVLVPTGGCSSTLLLGLPRNTTITSIRGREFEDEDGYKIVPTYHPSFLLRTYNTFDPKKQNEFDVKFINDIKKAISLTSQQSLFF